MEIDFEEIIEDIITACRHPPQLTRKIVIEYVEYINSQETERRVIHEKIKCMRCGKTPIDTTKPPHSDVIERDVTKGILELGKKAWEDTNESNKTILNNAINKLET